MQGNQPKQKEVTPSDKEQPAEITIDDFAKIDLRVAKVIGCEPVKKADRLPQVTT